jgi:tRNA(Ser,Leu) C12 N-acetylase TAN1
MWKKKLMKLTNINSLVQPLEIVSTIKSLIPEYISNNSTFEVLDEKNKNYINSNLYLTKI